MGLHFDNDLLKYNVSVFHNRFDNFIYANTLDDYKGFRLIEYSQDAAKFYGVDADLSYQISPVYNLGYLVTMCAVKSITKMHHVYQVVV